MTPLPQEQGAVQEGGLAAGHAHLHSALLYGAQGGRGEIQVEPSIFRVAFYYDLFFFSYTDGLEPAAGQLLHGESLIFSCKYGYLTRAGSR